MSSYISLETELEEWFEKPFNELPEDLQKRVERGFRPTPWDNLTSDDRRRRACLWDGWENPAFEIERRRLWDSAKIELIDELEEKIEEWEATDPKKDPLKKRIKEKELKKLRRKLRKATEVFDRVLGSETRTGKSPVTPKTKRDKKLQAEANNLAKVWWKEGRRKFTKKEIAKNLAASDEWDSMTAKRIVRILRVQW